MRNALTDHLVAEFREWTTPRKLTDGDAMDLLHREDLTVEQRTWLSDYVGRWDIAQRKEDHCRRILDVPITDEAGAMAFIQALVAAEQEFHLEDALGDDPPEIFNIKDGLPCWDEKEAVVLQKRVREIYALKCWTREDCPIGRMMDLEAKREGFASWDDMADADVKSKNFVSQ